MNTAALTSSSIEDRIRALPLWNDSIEISLPRDGLSNESWVVADASGRHVVRFGADLPFHHVFRDREALWSIVSDLHLKTPDIDFRAYAPENLARLDQALDRYRSLYGYDP